MRINNDIKLNYSDVLIEPQRSDVHSRSEVDLECHYEFKHSKQLFVGVPIMAANMDGVGTFKMAESLATGYNMFTCLVKSYTPEEIHSWLNNSDSKTKLNNHTAVSTGINKADLDRLDATYKYSRSIKYICVDVANGYSEKFLDAIEHIRKRYPTVTIIAGNVVTAEMTKEVIRRGADVVKVGIGPGSVCTTRIKTGVGYPQLSAVIECADAAHSVGGHIVADGGCSCPGDVAKAFAAGADFVMLGGMLAGTAQGGGTVIDNSNGEPTIQFYGMSSSTAQEKHGGTREYRASEGRVINVPYRGDVFPLVRNILGGVRSTCAYVGASRLTDLSDRTTFIRVNNGQQYNSVFEQFTTGE